MGQMGSQTIARIFGALFLLTFVTSIGALLCFQPVLDDPAGYVANGGSDNRIFFGAFLAFAFVAYYYYFVDESEIWEESGGNESPIRTLFSGDNLKNFLQVFVMMTGFWLTLNTISAILPGLLGDPVGLSSTNVTITLVIAYLILAGAYIAAGVTSQRIGRRLFLIAASVVMATVGTFLYYLLVGTAPQSLFVVIVLVTIITVLVTWVWALATVYINERFHTGVRASGFGIGYSLAVIPPAFYAYYQSGLATIIPFKFTPLPLLVIGALLILIGALWGPETKDVDFTEDPEVKAAKERSKAPEAPSEAGT
jgi:Na+/melibiose symporter-like transporter